MLKDSARKLGVTERPRELRWYHAAGLLFGDWGTSRLYVLPDATLVLPGHGPSTTIAESKAEYAVFASKSHPADLKGDVLWEM